MLLSAGHPGECFEYTRFRQGHANIQIAQELVKAGCNIHGTNARGDTILHSAAALQCWFIKDLVESCELDPLFLNVKGETPLAVALQAVINWDLSTSGLAVPAGLRYQCQTAADLLDITPAEVRPSLSEALLAILSNPQLLNASATLVEKLVALQLDVNSKDAEGRAALHLVANISPGKHNATLPLLSGSKTSYHPNVDRSST